MITDKYLRFSENQAITGTDVASTDIVDLTVARDIGEGENLFICITVGAAAFAGGTSIDFILKGSTDTTIAAGDPTIVSTGAIVTASLTAGSQHIMRIPPLLASLGYRYIGMFYDVTGTMTAGTVTVDVVKDIQDGKKFYASGFSVT